MKPPPSTTRPFSSRVLGRNLLTREWSAGPGHAGDVLLLHGLGDHSGRHDWAAGLAVEAGYRVFSFDWPGNGDSDGIRGDMPRVGEAVDLLEEIVEAHQLAPRGLFAHSTGGFLALAWLGRRSEGPALSSLKWAWLNSPLLRPTHGQPRLKIALASALARRFPSLTLSTGVRARKCFHTHFAARAEAERRRHGGHHRITLRFASELLAAESGVLCEAASMRRDLSVLLTQGAEDEICPPAFAEELFHALPVRRKVWILAAGARHEVYREPEPEGFTLAVRAWLVGMTPEPYVSH